MKKMFVNTCIIGAMLLSSPLAFGSTLTSMTKDEVIQAIGNKTFSTISAATLNGNLIDNKFTGYFSNDGKMKGKFKNKPDNAPQQDTGAWRVNDDGTMCFKWDKWDTNKERCVTFYQLQNGILVLNAQNGFESMIVNKDINTGDTMK